MQGENMHTVKWKKLSARPPYLLHLLFIRQNYFYLALFMGPKDKLTYMLLNNIDLLYYKECARCLTKPHNDTMDSCSVHYSQARKPQLS